MSWEKVKLGEISFCIQPGPFGSQLHNSDYADEGTPIIMPKDMVDGHIRHTGLIRVPEEHVARLQRHQVCAGNLMVARKGDVRKCVYITENENGWLTGSDCLKVALNENVCFPKYIYYQLRSPYIGRWLEQISIGATMPSINTGLLSGIEMYLPSLEIQRRIADILSAYDDLIENNRKQIKLLEEAAQRLYKEWFVDLRFPGHEHTKIVDGVPEGWSMGILDDIVKETGESTKKENKQEYAYYLPIDCLPQKSIGYIDTNDIKLAKSSLVSFDKGDIIFGAMRPYFHKVVVARDKGITRSTCFVLNSRSASMWGYVAMLLFNTVTVEYATQISVGTTMPYVRWKDMKLMPSLIPNKQIAISFDNLVKPMMVK